MNPFIFEGGGNKELWKCVRKQAVGTPAERTSASTPWAFISSMATAMTPFGSKPTGGVRGELSERKGSDPERHGGFGIGWSRDDLDTDLVPNTTQCSKTHRSESETMSCFRSVRGGGGRKNGWI